MRRLKEEVRRGLAAAERGEVLEQEEVETRMAKEIDDIVVSQDFRSTWLQNSHPADAVALA